MTIPAAKNSERLFFILLFVVFLNSPPVAVAQEKLDSLLYEEYDPVSTLVVEKNPIEKAKFPFIDVHSHHFRADGYDDDQMAEVVADMDGLNMGLAVNLSGGWGEKLVNMIESMKGRYPDRFVVFTNINFDGMGEPGWTEREVVEVFPAYLEDQAFRIEFWGDTVERVSVFDPIERTVLRTEQYITIYAAKIFVTPKEQLEKAITSIQDELRWRLAVLRENSMMLEAHRLEQRTLFDMEMLREVGYCSGVENYSRHLTAREPGERPYCLLDYFPDDFLMVIDESHAMLPQVRAMYNGDRARKLNLVEHGFRLPSALDNRPMTFEEFEAKQNQVIFVSATPGDYEMELTGGAFVEQVIRPTGIPDPDVEVRPSENQIDDLLEEVRIVAARNERVLVTTLTKRMAEDLADYLDSYGVSVRYLHSDIAALDRVEILRGLRIGDFDVLIGVNLLREGLDLPEVSLVVILDADKEGFLRSDRSLIQTAGRAARNVNSKIIMYADRHTGSMNRMIDETNRRREIQKTYNEEHGIIPTTVVKSIEEIKEGTIIAEEKHDASGPATNYYSGPDQLKSVADPVLKYLTPDQKRDMITRLQEQMKEAATNLKFEKAAEMRDTIAQLEAELDGS